jgi:hypothetical protein
VSNTKHLMVGRARVGGYDWGILESGSDRPVEAGLASAETLGLWCTPLALDVVRGHDNLLFHELLYGSLPACGFFLSCLLSFSPTSSQIRKGQQLDTVLEVVCLCTHSITS